MLPPQAERAKLTSILEQLVNAVEELLLSGLTTASNATKQTLSMAMQEAARFRLLRLGSTLRIATDELGRYVDQKSNFSRRRLSMFLNRAWLLGRGMLHAINVEDEAEYDRLNFVPKSEPCAKLTAVCIGVAKRVSPGVFAGFEFRFRVLESDSPLSVGQSVAWSAIFPIKKGVEIPAEGFLHLPQKQKFNPASFLEKKPITFTEGIVSTDNATVSRLTLSDDSKVSVDKPFKDWQQLAEWDGMPAWERLRDHAPGPLDLDNELSEEIVLTDYKIDTAIDGDEPGQLLQPITVNGVTLHAVIPANDDGKPLKTALEALKKAKVNPPLFGLMHYEQCRILFQPLTLLTEKGPEYLPLSKESISKTSLLQAMKF